MQQSIRRIVGVAVLICGLGCGKGAIETDGVVPADDSVDATGSGPIGSHPVGTALETTTGLNLRTGPSTGSAVILVIPAGASVTLLATDPTNGWYNIRYGSSSGWSSGAYLKVAGSSSTARAVSIFQGPVVPHAQSFADNACATVGCPYVLQTRPDHDPTQRQAIDFMQSSGGRLPSDGGASGDSLASYGVTNFSRFKLLYLIWEQRINSNDGRGWRAMADRGSITANHRDHVHVSFNP